MDETMFTLHPEMALIPGNWHHHLIRFDRNSGLLEYLIDGVPEAVVYVSRSGGEDSEIFTPAPGRAAPSVLKLGRGFTGYLDELRITNSFVDSPLLERYGMTSGIAATEIIDLGNYDSRLLSIDSTESVPGNTRIDYYYRISNRWFAPEAGSPSWKQILPGETLSPGIDGRYLQIMTELFPDGDGERSPTLSELKISYNRNLPPLPPGFVTAEAGDGEVLLRWRKVNDADIAGYRIYYGNTPGVYFGKDSAAGTSPVDAGNTDNFRITGLDNGKIYYFAVSSYDDAEIPQESIFSAETSVRPSSMFRKD